MTMTTHAYTRSLNTNDITVMSSQTSITVSGNKVSKLEGDSPEQSTIHVNFSVKNRKNEPCILAGTQELGFILTPQDAQKLGEILLEFAQSQGSVATVSQ
jgi:hypothetical protein